VGTENQKSERMQFWTCAKNNLNHSLPKRYKAEMCIQGNTYQCCIRVAGCVRGSHLILAVIRWRLVAVLPHWLLDPTSIHQNCVRCRQHNWLWRWSYRSHCNFNIQSQYNSTTLTHSMSRQLFTHRFTITILDNTFFFQNWVQCLKSTCKINFWFFHTWNVTIYSKTANDVKKYPILLAFL
jgi:hypothetical protein